jgi:2-polyprenyl-3-methyl-5-hydroxy-6-metoxy-1,4-benzoquinol methylase
MIQTASAPETAQITKQPACPVCLHSDTTRFAFERHGDFIYSCGSCSLEFQFPQPSEEKLASIYSGDYFLGSTNAEALENQRALKRATAVLYLDVLASFLKRNARLLEIGCGHGEFLLEAQCRGYAVEGLEYSQHATAEANSQLGRNAVRVGSPEMDCLDPSAYSLIAAFDVIEHLRRPRQTMEYLHTALEPDGMIAIVTPSLDSWSRHLLGRHWMEYKTEHLTYFGRKSLARLLDITGFTDVQFVPNYKTLNLAYVSAHFERFPVPAATPMMRLLHRIAPAKLARRPVNVVASGVMAMARKGR